MSNPDSIEELNAKMQDAKNAADKAREEVDKLKRELAETIKKRDMVCF